MTGLFMSEQAFGFDPVLMKGYTVETSSHRDYSRVKPDHVASTKDLVFFEKKDGMIVCVYADYKTGRLENIKHPRENWQCLHGSITLQDCDGIEADEFRAEIWHVDDVGQLTVLGHTYTEFELMNARQTIAHAAEQIVYGNTPATPGEHCADTFCPALRECPVTLNAGDNLRQIVTKKQADARRITFHEQIETDRQALDVLTLIPLAEKFIKNQKALARAHVDKVGGIKQDGKVFERRSTKVARVQQEAASALAELFPDFNVDDLAPRSITKTNIARVLGKTKADAALKALDDLGLITWGEQSSYRWRKGEGDE